MEFEREKCICSREKDMLRCMSVSGLGAAGSCCVECHSLEDMLHSLGLGFLLHLKVMDG